MLVLRGSVQVYGLYRLFKFLGPWLLELDELINHDVLPLVDWWYFLINRVISHVVFVFGIIAIAAK